MQHPLQLLFFTDARHSFDHGGCIQKEFLQLFRQFCDVGGRELLGPVLQHLALCAMLEQLLEQKRVHGTSDEEEITHGFSELAASVLVEQLLQTTGPILIEDRRVRREHQAEEVLDHGDERRLLAGILQHLDDGLAVCFVISLGPFPTRFAELVVIGQNYSEDWMVGVSPPDLPQREQSADRRHPFRGRLGESFLHSFHIVRIGWDVALQVSHERNESFSCRPMLERQFLEVFGERG